MEDLQKQYYARVGLAFVLFGAAQQVLKSAERLLGKAMEAHAADELAVIETDAVLDSPNGNGATEPDPNDISLRAVPQEDDDE